MFCIRCQKDVAYCTCPDINERLAALASHPNWAIAFCVDCNKAVDQCDCPDVGQEKHVVMRTGK